LRQSQVRFTSAETDLSAAAKDHAHHDVLLRCREALPVDDAPCPLEVGFMDRQPRCRSRHADQLLLLAQGIAGEDDIAI
jgi:hypothetical protein